MAVFHKTKTKSKSGPHRRRPWLRNSGSRALGPLRNYEKFAGRASRPPRYSPRLGNLGQQELFRELGEISGGKIG